ncbi:MAG: LysR family transcriptional regulator [Spirochaetales bacterium]|nr:LysR family transcriptional regulator [Spirochaetales bacterium]
MFEEEKVSTRKNKDSERDFSLVGKIWINKDGEPVITPGLVRIIKVADELGSLSAATKHLKISYTKAWKMVDRLNKSFDLPVLISVSGGASGGGTNLTEFGHQMIDEYLKLKDEFDRWASENLSDFFRSLN